MFQLPQQRQQGLGLALELAGQVLDLLQRAGEAVLLGGIEAHVWISVVARDGLSHTGC